MDNLGDANVTCECSTGSKRYLACFCQGSIVIFRAGPSDIEATAFADRRRKTCEIKVENQSCFTAQSTPSDLKMSNSRDSDFKCSFRSMKELSGLRLLSFSMGTEYSELSNNSTAGIKSTAGHSPENQ